MARRGPTRMGVWLDQKGLTRDRILANRWMRPFAARIGHRALWRFTRRSVPRGVALGLLVGIFLLIPGIQIIGVAMLAYPVRANIPIGAAMTFLSMPVTTPFILLGSVIVGNWLLGFSADIGKVNSLITTGAGISEWGAWLLSDAAPALLVGLAIISVVSAVIGYVLAAWAWRWWIVKKWRRRHHG